MSLFLAAQPEGKSKAYELGYEIGHFIGHNQILILVVLGVIFTALIFSLVYLVRKRQMRRSSTIILLKI